MKSNIKAEIEQHSTKQSTANLAAHYYHLKIKANPSFIYRAISKISTVKYMGAVVEWLTPFGIDPTSHNDEQHSYHVKTRYSGLGYPTAKNQAKMAEFSLGM